MMMHGTNKKYDGFADTILMENSLFGLEIF